MSEDKMNIDEVEEVEVDEVIVDQVQVEFQEKKKLDYFIIVKWILGIYLIGVLMNLNAYVLSYISQFVHAGIFGSSFMTIELVKFAEIIRDPLYPLLAIIPLFIPSIIIIIVANALLNRFNIFPGKHKKVYMIMLTGLMLIMTTIFL